MINNREKNNIAKEIYEDLIVKPKEEIIDICSSQMYVLYKKGREIKRLNNIINDFEEELEQYKQLGIKQFNRPYAKRYLEERRKEIPNLLYPDSEEIYMDYYDLKDRINKAIEYITTHKYPTMYGFSNDDLNKNELIKILKGSDK